LSLFYYIKGDKHGTIWEAEGTTWRKVTARLDCGKVTIIYIVNMATGVEGHYPGCELTALQFVKLYGYNEENILKLCESHGLINLKTNCRKCGKFCSDEKNCDVYENKKCKDT